MILRDDKWPEDSFGRSCKPAEHFPRGVCVTFAEGLGFGLKMAILGPVCGIVWGALLQLWLHTTSELSAVRARKALTATTEYSS